MVRVADRLKVLGQPLRLRLVEQLQAGPSTPQELSDVLGLSQQNVSKHLLSLHRAGVVARRPDGTNVVYTLVDESAVTVLQITLDEVCRQLRELAHLAHGPRHAERSAVPPRADDQGVEVHAEQLEYPEVDADESVEGMSRMAAYPESPDDGVQKPRAGRSIDVFAPDFLRHAAAHRLRALAHPDRLRIVDVLSSGPAHVGEVAAHLGLSIGAVSRHLRVLNAARVVDRSQRGNYVLYVLADRDVQRLAAVAYRGAATQVRRVIALAPEAQSGNGPAPAPRRPFSREPRRREGRSLPPE